MHLYGRHSSVKILMFTSAKIRNGSTYLASHLSANDYYAKGEKVTGEWVGQGAESLGLSGEVSAADFEALRINCRPGTGERLTCRTKETRMPTLAEARQAFRKKNGRSGSAQEVANFRLEMKPVSNRVAFLDFQCSAPKSISIMAVLTDDRRLREAHARASRMALEELEQFASRQNNSLIERRSEITGNICAAAFTHDASRALDPQLHTHFVIANATRSPNGRWYALNEFEMVKAVRYAGKVYQNELARAVRKLGYEIREVRMNGSVTGFEIEGVSDELCQRFSKRREEIEREIARFEKERGREPSVREISLITRETRSPDLKEITTPKVLAEQRNQLLSGEWPHLLRLQSQAKLRLAENVAVGREREALSASVEHLFERQSVFKEHEVLAEALNQSLGHLDLLKLKELSRSGEADLIRLTPENGLFGECATRQGLELEHWSVSYVNAQKGRCASLNPTFIPSGNLSSEQKCAVREILSSKDRIFSFRGVAGAGKTTTLREVQRGLQEAGHSVFAITPTTSAAKVLQEEGFSEATTVEDFLRNGEKWGGLKGSVVICDEAGLKSNRQGTALLKMAECHDLRILLVGDTRQHVSVESGDFLRVLEAHSQIGRSQVQEIRRQIPENYRAAISQMAEGDTRGGLLALDRMGRIKEGQSDYLRQAAADYLRLTEQGKALDRCVAVSFTWDENHRFTEAIREGLKKEGVLPVEGTKVTVHESLRWTNQQKQDWRRYEAGQVIEFAPSAHRPAQFGTVVRAEKNAVTIEVGGMEMPLNLRQTSAFDVVRSRQIEIAHGDKVLIRANDKSLGLINGQVLTVKGISAEGVLETMEGHSIPTHFRQWCHGYVVTSHKAQGRTADHVVVAAENLTAKGAYVACSLGRQSCSIHTPDKLRLLERLPEGDRRAVLDVRPSVAHQPASIQMRPVIWDAIKLKKSVVQLSSQSLIRKGVQLAQVNVQRMVEANLDDQYRAARIRL